MIISSTSYKIILFFRENLVLNISSLWEGYPHLEMTFMFKFFFIIQMSYWLHCYPELYFQRTKREEMPARIQYATVGLVYVAAGYLLKLVTYFGSFTYRIIVEMEIKLEWNLARLV